MRAYPKIYLRGDDKTQSWQVFKNGVPLGAPTATKEETLIKTRACYEITPEWYDNGTEFVPLAAL
jgi:hypothetical protein